MFHNGWFGHLHHDRRTPEGDDLATQIRHFQTAPLRATSEGGAADVARLLPYGPLFGLVRGAETREARFAAAFVQARLELPDWKPQAAPAHDFDEFGLRDDPGQMLTLDLVYRVVL